MLVTLRFGDHRGINPASVVVSGSSLPSSWEQTNQLQQDLSSSTHAATLSISHGCRLGGTYSHAKHRSIEISFSLVPQQLNQVAPKRNSGTTQLTLSKAKEWESCQLSTAFHPQSSTLLDATLRAQFHAKRDLSIGLSKDEPRLPRGLGRE